MGPDDLPGKPHEHYIVKDPVHGYRCLKCEKVGYVTSIREQSCKIPRPECKASSSSSSSPASPHLMGLSAAVVGRELSLMNPSREDMLKEMEELRRLEQELEIACQVEAVMEAQEALELEELNQQIMELERYQTEEEQLERALRESMEDAEPIQTEATNHSSQPPVATCSERPVDGRCERRRKRLRPLPKDDLPTLPSDPVKPPMTSTPADNVMLEEVDLKQKEAYDKYWSKFRKVATPQAKVIQAPAVCNLPDLNYVFYCFLFQVMDICSIFVELI